MMNTQTIGFSTSSRIVWAIAAKDILDGFKNKRILSTIFSLLFLLALYQVLPLLRGSAAPLDMVVYDAGQSQFAALVEEMDGVRLHQAESISGLENYLGGENVAALGILLPGDFDQMAASSDTIHLAGIVDHWVSEKKVDELRGQLEPGFSAAFGKPVALRIQGDKVLTQADGGHAFTAALSIVLVLFMVGLAVVPTLMLEERETRTMDALLVSPATQAQVVMGKALAGLVYSSIGMGLILAFNARLYVQWWLILGAFVLGALFHILLGLLVGTLVSTRQHLGIWTLGLAQPLLVTVGLLPIFGLLPSWLESVLRAIPTVALGQAVSLSLTAAVDLFDFLPALGNVAAWCGLLFLTVLWRFNRIDR